MTECQWGPGDGAGRYCLTHEAWMRAVIGTQCPVGELQAQVQRVRDVLSGAYINMTPPQITTNVYGDAGLVIAVTDVEYALEGDDA